MTQVLQILIVKTSALGDIVHTFPALAALKARFPEAKIDWVVEEPFIGLVQSHPFVNEAIPINTKSWRRSLFKWETIKGMLSYLRRLRANKYDLLFDFQGNTKSGLITAIAKAKVKVGFGSKTVWEFPNLLFTHTKYNPEKNCNVREESLHLVEAHCGSAVAEETPILLKLNAEQQKLLEKWLEHPMWSQNNRKIIVSSGSNWKNKQLSSNALFDFLKSIDTRENPSFFFIYGSEEEKKEADLLAAQLINSLVVEKLPFPVLQNFMAKADLVIAMDSLPLHLAATAGTATLGVFGPSSGLKFAPTAQKHKFIQGACPYGKTFVRRCPILRTCPTGACIKNLTGSDLSQHYYGS